MKRLSIKLRVTLWFTLVMFFISVIMFFLMVENRRIQVTNEAERVLIKNVTDFSRVRPDIPEDDSENSAAPPDALDIPPEDAAPPETVRAPDAEGGAQRGGGRNMYGQGVHYAVYDENGELIAGRIPFEFEDSEFSDGTLRTINSEGETYLVYDKMTTDADGNNIWIKGVSNLSLALNAVDATRTSDFFIIAVIIIFAAAGGYFIVWKALKPVGKMSRTAEEISESNDLSQRIALGKGKDEIYQLANVLDNMLDKIESSFESEKQFTSDASHELRTPVSVIVSECEYALDCAKSEDEYAESVTVIKRQAEKMTKLITELLLISRMDQKSVSVNFEKINLSELVGAVASEQAEINSTMPLISEIEENVYAMADEFLIARLFINLISNAFEYGAGGEYVKVGLSEEGGTVYFFVEDNGIGIPPEETEKIWERFYQVNKSRTNQKGNMGLGLSMVKQIAEIHKGELFVKSTPGQGSTFYFKMPSGI